MQTGSKGPMGMHFTYQSSKIVLRVLLMFYVFRKASHWFRLELCQQVCFSTTATLGSRTVVFLWRLWKISDSARSRWSRSCWRRPIEWSTSSSQRSRSPSMFRRFSIWQFLTFSGLFLREKGGIRIKYRQKLYRKIGWW